MNKIDSPRVCQDIVNFEREVVLGATIAQRFARLTRVGSRIDYDPTHSW